MDSEIATVGFESVRLLLNYVVVTVCMIVGKNIYCLMSFLFEISLDLLACSTLDNPLKDMYFIIILLMFPLQPYSIFGQR